MCVNVVYRVLERYLGSTSKESVRGATQEPPATCSSKLPCPRQSSENPEGELLELVNQAIEEAERFAHRRRITEEPLHGLRTTVSQL